MITLLKVINEARIMELEEGNRLKVSKDIVIDYPKGIEDRISKGEEVTIIRTLSYRREYLIDGEKTNTLRIGYKDKEALVGVNYVRPFSLIEKVEKYIQQKRGLSSGSH